MNPTNSNIFQNIPDQLPAELFECIFKRDNIRIERIISQGHITPAGQWYDQDWDEWVMLVQGQAIIVYEQDSQSFHLNAGDYLLIPAHTRHRVEWTPSDQQTVWLAVHLHDAGYTGELGGQNIDPD
ncbi:MAG: cupin domain-containing protein [Methylobacter sp.]